MKSRTYNQGFYYENIDTALDFIFYQLKMDILPDNITLKILRYLGWKERIRKEIICKKWKYLLEHIYERESIKEIRLLICFPYLSHPYILVDICHNNNIDLSLGFNSPLRLSSILNKIPFGSIFSYGDNIDEVLMFPKVYELFKKKCISYKESRYTEFSTKLKSFLNLQELRLRGERMFHPNYIPINLTKLQLNYIKLSCDDISSVIYSCKNLNCLYIRYNEHISHGGLLSQCYKPHDKEDCFKYLLDCIIEYNQRKSEVFTLILRNRRVFYDISEDDDTYEFKMFGHLKLKNIIITNISPFFSPKTLSFEGEYDDVRIVD